MYIESLKVFSDLAKTKSFSRAGELNKVSQSAVSQQITSLERKLGVSLVERGGRSGVSLTPEGSVFLAACEEILCIYARVGLQFQDLKNVVSGELRIAAVYSIGLYDLPSKLKNFRKIYPEVLVHVEYRQASQVYSAVTEGSVDLGLLAYPTRRPGLLVENFGKDEMVLICPAHHRLALAADFQLKDLDGERFVAFSPDLPTRKAVDKLFRERDVRVVHYMEFDNVETVKKAVEVEEAISLVPAKTVREEVAAGILAALELRGERIVRPLGVLSRRSVPRSAAVRTFVEFLKEASIPIPGTVPTSIVV